MIEPLLSDDGFLDDVRSAAPDRLHLWWLGQSGFLLAHRGRHILLDPYLSNSLTTKYANTDKPHVRISRRVIDPGRLDFIDVVTSSHNHTDHLDAETLRALDAANTNMSIICPAANVAFAAERLGFPPARFTPIDVAGNVNPDTRWISFAGFTAIPAAHESLEIDEHGRHRYVGYVVTFGGRQIYHSGDTVRYPGLAEAVRAVGAIDLAILPINGKLGNMNGVEAARLAKDIGAKLVVPCHYNMFEFNTAQPREHFVPECERIGQPYRVLELGERLTLQP
jgi:L-ascorbate metabolism protein UlaG (beta-lactamase superfamily)